MENIIKKIDLKRVSILAITLLLALFALFTSWITIGVVLIIIAFIVAALGLKKEVYTVTGSNVKRYTFYYEGERRGDIQNAVKGSFKEGSPVVSFITSGSGKIEVAITKDRSFAIVSLWHFVPHKYEAVGEPQIFEKESVTALCNYIEVCAGKKLF